MINSEDGYIRYYTGNGTVGCINYGRNAGGPDYGYTGISYTSGISWGVKDVVGAHIGNSIVFGKADQTGETQGDVVSIMRPDKPYLLIKSETLPVGQATPVGVSVKDADTTGETSTSSTVTVVESIFDKINVLSSAYGDISLKGGLETELELKDEDIVEGNSLVVTATTADNSVHGKSYSGAQLKIKWNPDHDHNDIIAYKFFGRKAII